MALSDELPDARDGLTRLQRDGLRAVGPGKRLRRGDRIFVAGPVPQTAEEYDRIEFHAAYDATVRLSQGWVAAHPLIEARGNFGSIDDDPPADVWFVEMRTTDVGRDLLNAPAPANDVLTGAFPTLLVNGTQAGLARFLPHNLREVAAALRARLDRPDLDLDGVMEHLPGPDFPTGGSLLSGPEIRDAYASGRGELRVRGGTLLGRDADSGRATVTVTEMPYLVPKGGEVGLIVEVAQLWHDRQLRLSNMQDTSSRRGMALVFEARPGVDGEQLRRQLFATSRLQHALEVRMLAEVDGQPRTLPLLAALDFHLETRRAYHRAAGVTDVRVDDAIRAELGELVERFGRDRRTEIVTAI